MARDPTFRVRGDRQIGFEHVQPAVASKRPFWRTYYLERAARIDGSSVTHVEASYDPVTFRPEVVIRFDPAGTKAWAALTAGNIGKKVAMLVDDEVQSAPIIQTAVPGGATAISMGGRDPAAQEREAIELSKRLAPGVRSPR